LRPAHGDDAVGEAVGDADLVDHVLVVTLEALGAQLEHRTG
jgi:hypothetical protein